MQDVGRKEARPKPDSGKKREAIALKQQILIAAVIYSRQLRVQNGGGVGCPVLEMQENKYQ